MIIGPLFTLRLKGMICPCCEGSENKSARQSLQNFNRLGTRVTWHTAAKRSAKKAAAGFMQSMFGRSNNNNNGAKNDSGETDGEATTLSQIKLVDATKDAINYGDPYPELQICPQKKQQQQSDIDTIGDGPLQRSSAMSFQLDIPLHHIQRVESESTLMIVIYTKDVHAIDEKKAGTEKEAARLAFQSSDDRDAACLDLKVLVEWNKHRQPEIEEELPADGIRNRAQKAAHFAKREIEMREKKRDRERRKAGHMSNMASGGLKYTAMAMANQSIT
mmetsp:Transcript_15054/g.41861  ORF Transcript_15054/g.41861 Transcript_15054/m.41861 type:complete len:275 (-) Transcript_15054:88-912(-)